MGLLEELQEEKRQKLARQGKSVTPSATPAASPVDQSQAIQRKNEAMDADTNEGLKNVSDSYKSRNRKP